VPLLPASSRRAVAAAHALFAELAARIRATPVERLAVERVSVPASVKARLMVRALVAAGPR
jgi:phytoene/squalene synthetase